MTWSRCGVVRFDAGVRYAWRTELDGRAAYQMTAAPSVPPSDGVGAYLNLEGMARYSGGRLQTTEEESES